MTSTTLYWIGGVCAAVSAISIALATIKQQRESSTEADKNKAELIAHQDVASSEIVANQNANTERILTALKEKNLSLQDRLRREYPEGYVLFGGSDGQFAFLPFDLHVEAKWKETRILLDREQKLVQLTIPQPKWETPNVHINISQFAQWTGPYEIGKPIPLNFVKIAGRPDMFFEVISDDPHQMTCLIGFKKQ